MKYILDSLIFIICFPLGGYLFGGISAFLGLLLANITKNRYLFLIILPFPIRLIICGISYLYIANLINNQVWFAPIIIMGIIHVYQIIIHIFFYQGPLNSFEVTLFGETKFSEKEKYNIELIREILMLIVIVVFSLIINFYYQ
jgi:hypothetical protein